MEQTHSLAIIGDNPEALLLSILYAETGLANHLVGIFGEDGRKHTNRPGLEEALWLLDILKKTEKIHLTPSFDSLDVRETNTWILTSHASGPAQTNAIEMTIRNLATRFSKHHTIAFSGLCSPHYTSTILKAALEKHSGLAVGTDVSLYYLPLLWSGEGLAQFKESPKVLARFGNPVQDHFEENILRVFPTLSVAPNIESAEASGLFSAIGREVSHALGLEFARLSEMYQVNRDDVLDLCKDIRPAQEGLRGLIPGRESIGTGIALAGASMREKPRLVRATHSINEEYQRRVLDMVRRALTQCGHGFRRSRVAILGTDGLLKNPWSKPESSFIIQTLRKKGAEVSLYPGDQGTQIWARIVGEYAHVESSLLRAVAKASCTIVALPANQTWSLDPDQLAAEMSRPGAVCDLTGVLEASNVEKSGLFYTSLGRGTTYD